MLRYESAVLRRAVHDRDFQPLIAANVTVDHFYNFEAREWFSFLRDYWERYGEMPSSEHLDNHHPELAKEEVPEDSIAALIDTLNERRLYNEVARTLEQVSQSVQMDPREAVSLLQNSAAKLSSMLDTSDDIDITTQAAEIVDKYDAAKNRKGVTGLPWPWDPLNKTTLGIHPGNLIFIFGRPKTLKTWILLVIANHIHESLGKRVVVATQELSYEDMRTRAVALFNRADYQEFRSGTLTTRAEAEFKENLEAWEESPAYVVCRLYSTGVDAISEFEGKLRQYDAAVGFLDGTYLLGDDWKEQVALTRGLKRLAQRLNIPIVGTCQENRQGQTAYSDSFLQDCDVLLRTKRTRDEEAANEVAITTPAMRESKLNGFVINAFPARNFTQKFTAREEEDTGSSQFTGED